MRIKSLELHGFKSFVEKTVLSLQPGISAVVGPNGCGKSNVVDAMRWAMGEQSPRRLRGKGMEDVIFNGSDDRAPVGMAEVTITFDNGDGTGPPAFSSYSEIQIARRLYRTGESEYLLNRTPCRLRDVQDFFRDTGIGTRGYTIVEQGQIAEIVSAKPEERRGLIEEAAGIGKYKARRREAESKIASTEQNLLRVTDVIGEIRRQISSIERQAKRAARYKRLRETLRVLELSLGADDWRELGAEIERARGRFGELREELTALEASLAERELAIQQKRLELTECERVLGEGNERLLALRTEIKTGEGRIEFARRERESLAETAAARRTELEALREQRAAREAELGELGEELRAMEEAIETHQERLARASAEVDQAREGLRELERGREATSAALVEVVTQIARAEDRMAAIDDRRQAIDARMRSADEVIEVGQSEASRADGEQRELQEGLRGLLAERDRLMGLLRKALETHEHMVARARLTAERVAAARQARETCRVRLASLRELLASREDVGAGARHLLERGEEARRAYGLRGLVRDVLEVDPEAERALEAVLAERADAIVVERVEGALSALEALRAARAGRAVFVLPPPPEPEPLGFAPLGQPLLERVRMRPGFEALGRALLGGVNLVDSLAQALEVYAGGRVPATFVTPQGDLLTPEGIVRGGEAAAGGPLARVREVAELEVDVERLEAEAAACEAAHRNAETVLTRASEELDNLRNRPHTAALAVANHEKDLERTRERVKALGETQEGRTAERGALLAEIEGLAAEREQQAQLLETGRQERTSRQHELDALALRAGSLGREVTRLETVAAERRVEHAGRAGQRDRLRVAFDRATAAAREAEEWIARREQEIASADARREELAVVVRETEQKLATHLRDEETARLSREEKREVYDRVVASVGEVEDAARELRREIGARQEAVGRAEVSVREAELRLAHLEDSIRAKWDVEIASWSPPLAEAEAEPELASPAAAEAAPEEAAAEEGTAESEAAEDEEAPDAAREARANAQLAQLPREQRRERAEEVRRKLVSLGDVNLGAIEEHEELGERFRFLSEQKADLEHTLGSLRDAIQRINRTSRKRFRETFEAVSKRFAENFPRLFRGGKASLGLTDSEDVLEAGIEIMAMPPGKRLQNVNLLSGGEKTLTALALLVSVFQVRPSPFFLLDEVDAALDDANVGRFNEIVRELAQDSQFILITHNKRTIEVADVLYGVTMERKGVSKLVSVELH